MSGDILGCHKWGGEWCYWHLLLEDREAAKYPTKLRLAPHNKEPSAKTSIVLRLKNPELRNHAISFLLIHNN